MFYNISMYMYMCLHIPSSLYIIVYSESFAPDAIGDRTPAQQIDGQEIPTLE